MINFSNIRAIRADQSGNLLAFLTEAANSSVQAHNTLKSILNKTTANLKNQLENLQLNKGDIKAIFDDLEKSTKESYNDAIDKTIPAVLTNDIKTTLNPENKANGLSFNQFKAELKDQGLDQEAKGFLNVIEKNIYNPAGVNFRQLNSSLKLLNAYHKNTKDPNFKDYINRALEGFLRRDIKAGIDNLFEQLPKNKVDQYKELYNTALNDYATMKQTLKDVKKLGLRDAHNSTEKALDSLIKFTKGQGDKLDNLSAISKGLSNSNREVLELNMLDRLFKKSLVDAQDISVLDSFKFMNHLEELKESTFKTQGAKDFIEIAKGFHRLFNQDSAIAKALKPTTGGTIGSSIATSVGGAAQFQVTKAAFGFIVRTLPYIPFAKALNDKVSGAALRYHIKTALNKSHSIEAFKQNLNKIANRAEFSNATKALIREIEQNLAKSVESGGSVSSGGVAETPVNTKGLRNEAQEAGQSVEGRALQSEVPVKVQDEVQTKADNAYQELAKIDTTKLNPEQQEILKVFKGEIPSTTIVGKDLKDLYRLETGSRKTGARKIIIKHFGTEKTGGLSADELLKICLHITSRKRDNAKGCCR
ncbi:hypothetical protein [Helicobacter suis]|uniref:Uncharacterized protein n=2 Tax=Helicobacter suis TaxID=104628 RepID=A0A6J4CXL4_9HELI|nr:hypothetical protein [Helicobacter suis]BCD69925.1 hypothetical protein SNTW_05700 [Helicobacter suis]